MATVQKAFVVTGAASGMGKATMKKLLGQGSIVHAIDLASTIPEDHGEFSGKQWSYPDVDVSSRSKVKATFDSITKRSPHLNGLVHCAGIVRPSKTSEEGDEAFEQLHNVNVVGTWITNTEFYRCVSNSRDPTVQNHARSTVSIVNLGSMASVRGIPGISGYVASKHAVLGLSRSFAQEWGSEKFRVNCVAPGAVRTPMFDPNDTAQWANSGYKGVLKLVAEPEELADTICFLLGDSSSHITGQVLEVNGGWP